MEIERREVKVGDLPLRAICRKCGKAFRLWFNGGELDRQRCCGLEYFLECVRIDFVVQEEGKGDQ